jgi:HrpA-like RNA helicase
LDANITPEILRVNLAQVVLQLKGMGVHDPRTFDFLTPPALESLLAAFELLFSLAALDKDMNLTDYGKKLARLPLDPTFGHLLLQSAKYGCTSEMLTAVAMMSTENIFYRQGDFSGKAAAAHRRFASYEGDIPTLLNVFQAWRQEAVPASKQNKRQEGKLSHGDWCTRNFISGRALIRALDVRSQLKDICGRSTDRNGLGMDVNQSCGSEREQFFKAICAGLFLQVASRVQATVEGKSRGNSGVIQSSRGRYKTKIGGRMVSFHPTSTMFGRNPAPKSVVYTEMLTTKKTYIRGVTQIREEWLQEVAPSSGNN